MSKLPSSPTLAPSTRQGQAVLALGEPVGLAGTLLGLVEHPIAIGRLRALIVELATSGRLLQRKLQAPRESAIGPASGELPEGWVRLPLSELVVDFQNGIAKRSGDRGTPIAVLRLADITRLRLKETELREIILTPEEQTKYQVDRGDFLVIRVNGSGELVGRFVPCTVQRQWAYSDHLIRVRPRADLVDQRYLCLFANSETARRHLVDKTVTTAGQKTINQGGLGSLPVVVPPIEEQKRIVAKVDQLMALCDDMEAKQNKKRHLATQSTRSVLTALNTAENAAALATAWQRLDINFPLISREPGMVADLRGSVLSLAVSGRLVVASKARLVDVPVGEHYDPEFGIPEHWKWAPLGQLCRFIDYRGRTPRKTKEGVRLITAKNVRMGYIKEDPVEYIAAEEFDRWMTRGLPAYGDVLFTTEAPLGNVAQLLTRERVALAQRIITLHPIVAGLDPAYLRMALMSPLVQAAIKAKATGTTAQGIKAARLKLVPFPVPPPDEQARMVARVDALMSLLDDLEAKLRKQEETATRLAESLAAAVAA